MMQRLRDEHGLAMVVGIMVAFVVLLLSLTVVSLSIHNSQSSDYDRRRLLAVASSEAGVSAYYVHLETNKASEFSCSLTGGVDTGPSVASWSATLQLYGPTATQSIACPAPSGVNPAFARITSIGQAPSGTLLRRLETFVRLSPVYGGFGAAVLATSPTSIGNKLIVEGNTGNDADLYISCPSDPCTLTMSNNQTIAGNVYVQGEVVINNSVTILGDLWAKGNITMSNSARVVGNAKSSTGSISISSPAVIEGSATAATIVNAKARVLGLSIEGVTSDPPPSYPLPEVGFTAAEQASWDAAGYQVNTYNDCTAARNFIAAIPTTANTKGTRNYVVRITATCALLFGNNTSVSMPGNLAIITDGSITMSQKVTWTAAPPDGTSDLTLFLISRYRTGLACGTPPGPYDITTSNNTDFLNLAESPILKVFMYSPCAVNLYNQTAFNGQVLAKTVNVANQTTVRFAPSVVPGSQVTGFKQDVQFLREIVQPAG
jgi:cytoskeletal protein CcmA (bactofilin family)